jgi:3-oxoacyl-[acyl-carrier protein] reductase
MDLGLSGKVAWVIGASSGLGAASARALASEGTGVAISSRSSDDLEKTARSIASDTGSECVAVPLDVTDSGAITDAASQVKSRLGPIDVLVGNSGGPPPGGFDDFSDDDMMAAFELTTASAWRLTKAVLPDMRARGSGCLIYLTSGSTKEIIDGLLLSNMMRASVVGMMKTLAHDLGGEGIRALCVAPGRIRTKRLEQLDASRADKTGASLEEVEAQSLSSIPAGRYGDPKEFGEVVAFLASDRASYVSGVSASVDGGTLRGLLS